MPHITESIIIRRPRQEVWDYVVDVRNTPRWNHMFLRQEVLGGGPVTSGATIRSITRMAGRRIDADAVVTGFEEPHRSTLAAERPLRVTGNYLLEDIGGQTLFIWHMDAEGGLGGVFGMLSDPVVVAVFGFQLRRAMRRLKRNLEQSVTAVLQGT